MNAQQYAAQNAAAFLEELKEFIRIPSVSTLPEHKGDTRRAAEWLAGKMSETGIKVEVMPTDGHPVVYGEWLNAGSDAPTVLVYGHYDVQPAVREDGWDSEPFEPTERDGFLFARGSSDDKGQAYAQVKAAASLLATEAKSPVNLKFLIEGEEEIGSPNLLDFIVNHRELLKADVCVISDTGMPTIEEPWIVYALRGMVYMELEVFGPKQDLHSGGFGGSVHNPVQAIAEIISRLHNEDGSVNVPGFYNDVLPLSEEERADLAHTNMTDEQWREATGAPQPWGEPSFTLGERIVARPTLEINGVAGGFYGAGAKTVLPAKALAKISCRLVANQNPETIYKLVRDQIARLTPPTVRSELRLINRGDAALTDPNHPTMKIAIAAYERGWGVKPLFARGGGSIPVVADFQRELKIPVILMGFGLNTDGAHGPNENFSIAMYHKGIQTAIAFFEEAAQLKR